MKFAATGCLAIALLATLGAADDAPGKEVFERRCSGCHALNKDREGPRLGGVYGRTSGTVAGFQYSEALQRSHIVWNAATLDQWLADPEKLVPHNDMSFRLVKADERSEIIEFLKRSVP
jgi:cytochrome c